MIGEKINILGPLGHGYDLVKGEDKKILLAADDVGVAPLIAVAEELVKDEENRPEIHILYGCQTLSTLKLYACGPNVILKKVAEISQTVNVSCQVSLEERMACGFGVCNGCVVKVQGEYKRVCIDGPVFETKEVDWS